MQHYVLKDIAHPDRLEQDTTYHALCSLSFLPARAALIEQSAPLQSLSLFVSHCSRSISLRSSLLLQKRQAIHPNHKLQQALYVTIGPVHMSTGISPLRWREVEWTKG